MKKLLVILIAIIVCTSVFVTGCNQQEEPEAVVTKEAAPETTTEAEQSEEPAEPELVNNTYKTGLPIVEEQITLEVAAIRVPHQGPYAEMGLMVQLQEDTNINLNFIEMPADVCLEKISLMFASQDFPDILWRGPNDQQIMEAASAGLAVSLNDLIDEYAPNWTKIFADNPLAKSMTTMPDGNIYSFPYILENESGLGMRDVWFLNKDWLDIVGKEVPTTVDEYFDVMMSFKDGIDAGTFPSDGVPWYWRYNEYTGGQLDFFGLYGVLISGDKNYQNQYLAVEDGTVVFSATKPGFKEAVNSLNKFYDAGIIPAEAFTDDKAAFNTKVNSKPAVLGAWHGFSIKDAELQETYIALEPLASPNGAEVKWRQQTSMVDRHYMTIFATCEYPEASVRLADLMASEEYSLQGIYGLLGTHIEKTDSGYSIIAEPEYKKGEASPLNFTTWYLPKDLVGSIELSGSNLYRKENYEVYKPYVAPIEEHFPRLMLTEEQNDAKALYETDILAYVNEMQAKWIVDGGADEDWDAYLAKLEEMHLSDLIAVYQEALDSFIN